MFMERHQGQKGMVRSEFTACFKRNALTIRPRGTLTKTERLDYIKAVKCLQSKPSRYPSTMVPGAKSRVDDFTATHINQTLTIHGTGNFLGWHRYYVWLYEQALQDECGYKGTQPVRASPPLSSHMPTNNHHTQYWDWTITAESGLSTSPIFDGSETSMSGNGHPIPNQQPIETFAGPSDAPPVIIPAGTGGGCVASGPFQNLTINLGPVALDVPGRLRLSPPTGNPFAYNPRCLKRDLTDAVNRAFSNATSVLNTIIHSPNIDAFQTTLQIGIPGKDIGIHSGGHYAIGGDPGRDIFVSPGDPVFYLHHANVDRVWWMWQMLDEKERVWSEGGAIAGTRTIGNHPPSENATLEDFVDYGFAAGPSRRLGEVISTRGGPFCYVYM